MVKFGNKVAGFLFKVKLFCIKLLIMLFELKKIELISLPLVVEGTDEISNFTLLKVLLQIEDVTIRTKDELPQL